MPQPAPPIGPLGELAVDPRVLPPMSTADFEGLRLVVHQVTGIALADSKRTMLASRLAGRLRDLGLADFRAYREKLGTRGGLEAERQALTNAVTTNKTSFFRERHHFDFIGSTLVPEWTERARRLGRRELVIWSAACSTGQEPWTIAMTLAERLPDPASWRVRLLATDIDTEVLGRAEAARYTGGELEGISPERLTRHFEADGAGGWLVKPALRRWVTFGQLNFMEDPWPMRGKFDLILCRNASIYFEPSDQARLFHRLCDHLVPRGWLLVGHAEVLHWMSERMDGQPGGMYRRKGSDAQDNPRFSPPSSAPPPSASLPSAAPPSRPPAPAAATRRSPSPVGLVTPPTLLRVPSFRSVDQSLEVVTITVGETHASNQPVEVKTLLGSCVAACMFDPTTGIGGMNHFLLPHTPTTHEIDRQRFGTHAMESLINGLMRLGADRRRLRCKLFGGGNVLGPVTRRPTVGEQNAEFAVAFLEKEGIQLVASRLGGNSGVEVRFHPHSGRAFVRDIARELIDIRREEAEEMPLPRGDAELFI